MRDIREDSPLVPALLSKIHEEASKDLMDYKVRDCHIIPLYGNLTLAY